MKLKQISLFIENKTGSISAPCKVLADAGVDISTLMLADTKDYGILRLLARDWERAKSLLEKAGYAAKTTDVVAVEVEDRPGGLAKVLEALERHSIDVDYMYAFTESRAGKAVLIFRFENPDQAIERLAKEGIGVLDSPALFS